MKIRKGFVANSSSSSFLVIDPAIKTTGECAYFMLQYLCDERGITNWRQLCLNFLERTRYDDPIVIPWTINYETWIWKNRLGICVDTCNNHGWYDIINYCSPQYPDDWKYNEKDDPNYDPFVEGYYEAEFLDLSNMKKTKREDFVSLWDRKYKNG